MIEFLYKVGERVVINITERDEYGDDPTTGLYIPSFFQMMNGLEFKVKSRFIDPVLKKGNIIKEYPRYRIKGVFTDYCGVSHELDDYYFDEHWLLPVYDDIAIEDDNVDFF